MVRLAQRLVAAPWFDPLALCVIVLNAAVLGAETYESVDREHGALLDTLNNVMLGFFVLELTIRIAAFGRRPQDFFKDGWNVFDFVTITAGLVPGLRQNATLLRVVRLLRIVRAVRLLPDLRILIVAVGRSIPGVASLAAITLLLVYVYGMIGWLIFEDHDPDNFADIGQSMITMFVLLTLENLPDYNNTGLEYSDWTLLFYISYVLLAAFLIFNLFIGIVINSMEEARSMELERAEKAAGVDSDAAMLAHVHALKKAVEELEREISASTSAHRRASKP